MGNESSTPVAEDVPPATLESRTLDALAKYIKEGRAKKIVVMSGAGISTSAGIPDFRSPETGLYANLARLNLPFAEAVFDISYFRQNPLPFYTLAHELYPGRYRPTVTHSFITLLHKKSLLLKLFTQNIDCLEREAGVPADKIIEAHGSFATQRCIDCHTEYPSDKMREHVSKKEVPRCLNAPSCNGLVKPDIVFFGEALPEAFHRNRSLPADADLAIVMGTSLTVQTFASLPSFVTEQTPRLLINLERVGGLGSRADDVLLIGDCDEGVRKLADALGWREELEEEWAKTEREEDKKARIKREQEEALRPPKTKDEKIHDEIETLTRDIDQALKFSEEHKEFVRQSLADPVVKKDGEVKTDDLSTDGVTNSSVAAEEKKGLELSAESDEAVRVDKDAQPQLVDGEEGAKTTGGTLSHVFPHITTGAGEADGKEKEKPSL